MAASRVYLDHNATAPVCAAARAAVAESLDRVGNPSSVHRVGAAARQIVEQARDRVAALVAARSDEVVFTSGGTEANHLALLGVGRHLVVAASEHDSVLAPARRAPHGVTVVPVNGAGLIDLDALGRALDAHEGVLVSLMLANNETGVRQPVGDAAALAHSKGALVHCDAVQGPGKVAIDVAALGADLVSLSAHKFGGPMGVGALIVRKGVNVAALQTGGGQESYRRAGTQNVPGIAGFGAAAAVLNETTPDVERLRTLRDRLEAACQAMGATVMGAAAPRLPNTSCLTMPRVSSETQVMAFDLDGIAVSAGAACSSGKVGPSNVLAAMGVAPDAAGTAIRVSIGPATHDADIDRFIDSWAALYRRKQQGEAVRRAS